MTDDDVCSEVLGVEIKQTLSLLYLQNGLQKVYVLLSLIFNFASKYAIRKVQVSRKEQKCNGTHQLLFYADGVNLLCKNICTIKKNM